jgi:transposase
MSTFLSVRALYEEGAPKKAIARRLGVDPRTVRKYIRRIERGEVEPRRARVAGKLDGFREVIEEKVEFGLTAVQIYQDLCDDKKFDASYETVKREVRRHRRSEPEAYCRMKYRPGEEAQLDFGEIGRVPIGGKSRTVHLLVMTLCFSRYAKYSPLLDQRVPRFLMGIRGGFEYFGGAPERTKPDNLRSAVLISALGERIYQEDFFRFCTHYGTVPDAARPATPTDKGRTERDIGYAKGNCFNGRSFDSHEHMLAHVADWQDNVANVRVHGTTRRRPVDLFQIEKQHLRPLPNEPYEIAEWGQYKVRKDCHVHVGGNYYSVPYEFVGQKVLVRINEHSLTVFADRAVVARHPRVQGLGEDVTDPSHYPATKRLATQQIHRRRLDAIRAAGPYAAELLARLKTGRWVFGDQVGRLARLLAAYGDRALELACRRALFFGATDGACRIEQILKKGLQELPLPNEAGLPDDGSARDFGRSLSEYEALLNEPEVIQ